MVGSWLDALPGQGEMLRRVRAHHWDATSLGPPDQWPERLRGAVSLSLCSRFPLMVAWGPDLIQIYNDGYLPIFGEKHPQLGVGIKDTWPEIWDVIGPMLDGVMTTHEPTWAEDQQLWIDRLGFPEDTYFTFSYSPILDEHQQSRGVLVTAVETTERVVAGRRAVTVAAVHHDRAQDEPEAAALALSALEERSEDVPFALLWLRDGEGHWTLAASCGGVAEAAELSSWAGLPGGAGDAPQLLPLPAGLAVLHAPSGQHVRQAAVVGLNGHGLLVVGLSPCRRVDDTHLQFVAALARQVTGCLAIGSALAAERRAADERVEQAKQAAAQARLADEQHSRFQAARIAAWTLDLQSGEVSADQHLGPVFGVEANALVMLSDAVALIDPADHERILASLEQIKRHGGEYSVEFSAVPPQGGRRILQARASTAPDERGQPRLLHGVVWDATDLLAAKAELRRSDEQFRQALAAAPWGIAVVERHGLLSRPNRALCDLLGMEPEQLSGRALADLVHPEDRATVERLTAGSTRPDVEPEGVVFDVRLLRQDGESVWAGLSAAPVREADGSLSHAFVHVHDLSERKALEADLTRLAEQDALTGLANRRRFTEAVEHALEHSASGLDDAVLMIDMDGLKGVNDSLGHAVGDALLRGLARVLRDRLRSVDVIARLGGDEFAVLLVESDLANAVRCAQELVDQFSAVAPLGAGASLSVGVTALGRGQPGRTAEEAMGEADDALYVAKDEGGAQVRNAVPMAPRAALPTQRRAARVRDALDHGAFALHSQVITPLQGPEPVERAELLLRMIGEGDRILLPTNFLLAAERSSLVQDIDRWVLRAAARGLAVQQRAARPVRWSVNVSARSVAESGMAAEVLDALDAAGADPSGLIVEITETAVLADGSASHSFIADLRRNGVEVALDDFGSGFTSLQHLRRLEVDYLKIDGTYIRSLLEEPANRSVVTALIGLSRDLGIRVVAEHVRTPEALTWLAEQGADYAQGFLLGEPEPVELS